MATNRDSDPFADLSPDEHEVIGPPADYGPGIHARRGVRSDSAQFSVRLDRSQMEALQSIAQRRGLTFSRAVREAIERYVGAGGYPGLTNVTFSGDALRVIRVEGAELPQLQPNRGEPLPDESAANLEGDLVDLMKALEASVQAARQARSRKAGAEGRGGTRARASA